MQNDFIVIINSSISGTMGQYAAYVKRMRGLDLNPKGKNCFSGEFPYILMEETGHHYFKKKTTEF
jgi:hypothetical protein